MEMFVPFRHSAGFGKRIEFWIIGRMLKEGMDVYVPLVDDNAIDAVVRREDGSFVEVQIKARSHGVKLGDGALFAAIPHEIRANYWFVFYSERLDRMWIMTSAEFLANSYQNKTGKNKGLRSIWFNGTKMNPTSGAREEYPKESFSAYQATDFRRILAEPAATRAGEKKRSVTVKPGVAQPVVAADAPKAARR